MLVCSSWNRTAREGGGYCARRLVIDHRVNVGSHTSSGPTSKTQGDAFVPRIEQQSSDVVTFCSGMELFIVGRAVMISHNSDISKDSPECEGVSGVDCKGWTSYKRDNNV